MIGIGLELEKGGIGTIKKKKKKKKKKIHQGPLVHQSPETTFHFQATSRSKATIHLMQYKTTSRINVSTR
jgi:hypothetical protein